MTNDYNLLSTLFLNNQVNSFLNTSTKKKVIKKKLSSTSYSQGDNYYIVFSMFFCSFSALFLSDFEILIIVIIQSK